MHLKGIVLSKKSDLYLNTIYISVKYTLKSNYTYMHKFQQKYTN